jgi:hypothetical protein
MTPEQAAALRAPFAAELVGKLPRVWCGACRDARGKVCSDHSKSRCGDCGNNITSAHLHLDYVGHADVTDRLLTVDPLWTWEPLAVDPSGLPVLDRAGGLWIRLTVLGVSRPGYGHADGKNGGDAVKEAIGDAIRNASMRFGIALDLWRREKPPVDDGGFRPPARKASPRKAAPANREHVPDSGDDNPRPMVDGQRKRIMQLLGQIGMPYNDASKPDVLQLVGAWVGRPVGSMNDLSFGDARTVIACLEERAVERPAGHGDGPTS